MRNADLGSLLLYGDSSSRREAPESDLRPIRSLTRVLLSTCAGLKEGGRMSVANSSGSLQPQNGRLAAISIQR